MSVTPIPDERAYEIEIAVKGVAKTKHDGYLTAPPTTAEQVAEAKFARWILTDGNRWRALVQYAQAGVANGEVNWESLTYAQIQSAISNAFMSAAMVVFGPEPALSE